MTVSGLSVRRSSSLLRRPCCVVRAGAVRAAPGMLAQQVPFDIDSLGELDDGEEDEESDEEGAEEEAGGSMGRKEREGLRRRRGRAAQVRRMHACMLTHVCGWGPPRTLWP